MSMRRKALLASLKVADLLVVAVCLVLTVGFSLGSGAEVSIAKALAVRVAIHNVFFVLVYLAIWHFTLSSFGLYQSYRLAMVSREWRDLLMAVAVSVGVLVPCAALLKFDYVTPAFLCAFGGLAFIGLATERRVLRWAARAARLSGHNLRDIIIVGDGDNAIRLSADLAKRRDFGYHVVDVIDVPAATESEDRASQVAQLIDSLTQRVEQHPVDEVFVTVPLTETYGLIPSIIASCESLGVVVRVVARVADLEWARATIDEIDGKPVLTIFSGPPEAAGLLAKRAIDVAGAVVGLVVLAPVLLLTAIVIKMDSKGPVFFVQERVGRNRRRFNAFKFRTMVEDAESMQKGLEHLNEASGPIFKIQDDPRSTRVGRFLRRTSLDELPQLRNVLVGEMSLVGPRPLPVRDVERIDVRWHKRRFSVKPGMTGMWQASGRTSDFEDWVKADMQYIDAWSLSLDFKIMAKTIPAVLYGQGAH